MNKTYNMNDVQNRASNKAFVKIHRLNIDLKNLKHDLKLQRYGPITKEEVIRCIRSTETELKVWNYITKLIETDEN